MRIALLSNINTDPVYRQLKRIQGIEIYDPVGYGNELGVLLNKESAFYAFKPEAVFILCDTLEIIHHELEITCAEERINEWFDLFVKSMREEIIYYISDAYLFGFETELMWDRDLGRRIENIWSEKLRTLMASYSNIRLFDYSKLVRKTGEKEAFSMKMWYMGKILHSTAFHRVLADEIKHKTELENRTPRKVLLLDLDNTLWRGLAGEHDITPVMLSEDGIGLVYKNFQRAIKQLKNQGVVLGIVSKNNEEDVNRIFNEHPHMVLKPDDFAVKAINWDNKADNIVNLSTELNVGLESIVFIDDSPVERELVRQALPDVAVPEFPDRPEELTGFIADVYHEYFEKAVVTDEDLDKTEQYRANNDRKKLLETSVDFEGYLDSLDIKLLRVDAEKNKDRLIQLMNKTNQFNLTTRRFTQQEISEILDDKDKEIFLYRVTDRFGDNGIVAAAIVEYTDEPVITEFTMSCRIMGRKIENAIVEDMENRARERGFDKVTALFRPTEKNGPVKDLYPSLGYKLQKENDDGTIEYSITFENNLTRNYHLERVL